MNLDQDFELTSWYTYPPPPRERLQKIPLNRNKIILEGPFSLKTALIFLLNLQKSIQYILCELMPLYISTINFCFYEMLHIVVHDKQTH